MIQSVFRLNGVKKYDTFFEPQSGGKGKVSFFNIQRMRRNKL